MGSGTKWRADGTVGDLWGPWPSKKLGAMRTGNVVEGSEDAATAEGWRKEGGGELVVLVFRRLTWGLIEARDGWGLGWGRCGDSGAGGWGSVQFVLDDKDAR